MKRHKISKRESRKMFTSGAMRVKAKNLMATPMRGGFRL